MMTPKQKDGVTKARLANNITRLGAGSEPFADNAAYMAFVTAAAGLSEFPASAADSYAAHWANMGIADLRSAHDAAAVAQGKADGLAMVAEAAQTAAADAASAAQDLTSQARTLIER